MASHSPIVAPGTVTADATVLGFCILAGTFGNVRALVLLRRPRTVIKVPHVLLASLCTAGLISSLVVMPGRLVALTQKYLLKSTVSTVACKIVHPFGFACTIVNGVTLSLMAVDRQDCVLRPYRRRLTQSNVKKVILTIWVATIGFTLVLFVYLIYDRQICRAFEPYKLMVNPSMIPSNSLTFGVLLGVIYGTSFFVIIVSYIRILKRLRSSTNSTSVSFHRRQEIQLTKMTFKTCAIFILCWFPVVICIVGTRIGRLEGIEIRTAKVVTMFIARFNYVANPIIYLKMLKTIRSKILTPGLNQAHRLNQTAARNITLTLNEF